MLRSPYEDLPSNRFWRTGVAQKTPQTIEGLYRKRFDISKKDRIATAGSCFAQHISRQLRARGCVTLDLEPPPPGLSPEDARDRSYSIYSARYGNIYTARQLLQLLQEAFGLVEPADIVWERDGRFYDSQRPAIEPGGFDSPEQVLRHRAHHLARVRRLFSMIDLLIFTFGLTEAWEHRQSGTVFPTAPGTIAGTYDPELYVFRNFSAGEIRDDFLAVRNLLRKSRPDLRFLITVSPVPITATASGIHVLQASTYTKSTLRSVCGELYSSCTDIDYFPGYELVTSPFARGQFYERNMRSVTPEGVAVVMDVFFSEHSGLEAPNSDGAPMPVSVVATQVDEEEAAADDELVCEEALLEAFAR